MIHLLDNPVWSALNTGNKNLAQGTASVKYYPTEVSPFVGLKKNDSTSLMDLYNNTPDNNELYAVVDLNEIDIPQPWNLIQSVPLLQMVCENPIQRKPFTEKIINLSVEHIPQMLALTQLTNPGPFRQHTIDYGHYQGIFDGKNLVAMAGQRMYLPPYVEISAICTHPNYLGRGYAAQLI
jgi:predicted GNAT family acetyltransferase